MTRNLANANDDDFSEAFRDYHATGNADALALLQLMERDQVVWRPDKGHPVAIAGTLVGMTERTDSPFGAYPILVIDDGTTLWQVHALGTVARNEIARQTINIGDTIGIKDQGRRTVENGQFKGSQYRAITIMRAPRSMVQSTEHQSVSEV